MGMMINFLCYDEPQKNQFLRPFFMRRKVVKTCALRYIQIHKDKMADTSAHNKQVKNFMGAAELMLSVEDRKL